MIKTDSWNTVTLLCGNHGEDFSHKMQLKEGPHSLFYSCPEYKSIYGTNHEGRSCNNRLTLVDFERMLNHLNEKSYAPFGQEVNLTEYTWTEKGVTYKVLEHKGGRYKVLMLNKKAVSK